MKALLGKALLVGFLALVGLWLLGRLVLTVQLPERAGRRDAFPDPMAPGLTLEEVFRDLPAEGGGRSALRLLEDNTRAWLERWRLLADARERLDVCYFILKPDVFGLSFLGHLVRKAEDGVELRLLLDAMGTRMSRTFQGNDYLDALVASGRVSARMYRPLVFRYSDAFLTLNPAAIFVSEHDKILLADGRRALIGGRNISREYFAPLADDPGAFRDTDLLLSGPRVGAALQTAFDAEYGSGEAKPVTGASFDLEDSRKELILAYRAMDAWLHGRPVPAEVAEAIRGRGLPWLDQLAAMPDLRGALTRTGPPPILADVRLLDSRCRLMAADDHLTRSLIRLVRSSREEIFIQSPYLVLPGEAVEVLAEAAGRGVRITVLTNSPLSSDNPMSQGAFLEQWPELLARVPGLRLFVAADRHNLHGKLAVFDRRLSLVGTYNLDPLSMALNSELLAAVWSPDFAGELLAPREEEIAGSGALVEYRIARRHDGTARRDGTGRPVVAFGAEDHLDLEKMSVMKRYRHLYRLMTKLKGDYPWY